MGLLKKLIDAQKKTPGYSELLHSASSLSNAIAQVITGKYPPDFLESVIEGSRDAFGAHFAAVSAADGAARTRQRIRAHMIDIVNIHVDGIQGRAARDHLKAAIANQVDAVLALVVPA